jgi:hypothetical protein
MRGQIVGDAPLAAGAALGFEPVDEVDGREETATSAGANAVAGDGDGQMALARAGSSDQHGVALFGYERPAGEAAHERLIDRRSLEYEVVDVLGERQLGDGELVLDRARLLFGDFGCQEIADEALRFMLAFQRDGERLVIGRFHAVELQLAHHVEHLGPFHHVLLMVS